MVGPLPAAGVHSPEGPDVSQDIATCQTCLTKSGCEGRGHRATSIQPFCVDTYWADQEGNRLHPVTVRLKLCQKGFSVNILHLCLSSIDLNNKLWYFSLQMDQPAEPAQHVCTVYNLLYVKQLTDDY